MKTAYEQILENVLPQVKSYKTDITEHDKKSLENYTGKFIYGSRETGTQMIKLENSIRYYLSDTFFNFLDANNKDAAINKIERELMEQHIWVTRENKNFYFFDGKELKEYSRDRVKDIYISHVCNLCNKLREDEKLFNEETKPGRN